MVMGNVSDMLLKFHTSPIHKKRKNKYNILQV
mgnify:CR=1 FL=1